MNFETIPRTWFKIEFTHMDTFFIAEESSEVVIYAFKIIIYSHILQYLIVHSKILLEQAHFINHHEMTEEGGRYLSKYNSWYSTHFIFIRSHLSKNKLLSSSEISHRRNITYGSAN